MTSTFKFLYLSIFCHM